MRSNKMQGLITWACTSVILGLLPWLVNMLVNFISGSISIFTIFRINDLMFFVITLNTTTMLELFLRRNTIKSGVIIISLISMFILAIGAALFIGIASFYTSIPPTSGLFAPIQLRLIICCLVLCILAIAVTFGIQIHFIKEIVKYEKK